MGSLFEGPLAGRRPNQRGCASTGHRPMAVGERSAQWLCAGASQAEGRPMAGRVRGMAARLGRERSEWNER
eukprot:4803086-Pyramimonas_sp.AAC.1